MIVGQANTGTSTTALDGSRICVTDGNNLMSVAGVHSGATSTGVYGQSSGTNGKGVWGYSGATNGVGVLATSAGNAAPLRLSSTIPAVPPASGVCQSGTFLVIGGHLYYCYSTGVGPDSRWARLSTSLVTLASPIRVYDSRVGFEPAVGTKSKYADGEERTVDTKYGGAVPAGATAAVVNLAATNTNPGGFFTAWRNGVPWPGTASINWPVNKSTVSNQVLVGLDANAVFRTRMQGVGGADLVVDVVAYYT